MNIHYEKHPVTAERKAELRAKGLKIVDARFAPKEPAKAKRAKAAPKPAKAK